MTVQNKGHVIMSTDEVVEVSIVSSLFHSGYATSIVPKGHAALVFPERRRSPFYKSSLSVSYFTAKFTTSTAMRW